MLGYVVDFIMNIIDMLKGISPFKGSGYAGMFEVSAFTLIVGFSIISLILDYFNGDSDKKDD